MRMAGENFTEKRNVYDNGRNSASMTLRGLSIAAEDRWGSYPLYNIYRYSFEKLGETIEGDDPGFFDGEPIGQYANSVVDDLFLLNITRIEADGALAFNVLMACWSSLFEMLSACKRNDADSLSDMNTAVDAAAAYWIGAGQVKGDGNSGYFLYNLAEVAGARFDQDIFETRVNTLVLETFAFLKVDIASDRCAQGETGYVEMRKKVKVLISMSNVALVQSLIHHIEQVQNSGISDFCELYALALYSQIDACDSGLADRIFQLAIAADVTAQSKSELISVLQQSYSCLGIKCSDVGSYRDSQVAECADSVLKPMAGYVPSSDVRRKSFIDRDIKHIAIQMYFDARDAALDYYMYGWHTYFSLHALATDNFSPHTSAEFSRADMYFKTQNMETPDIVVVNALTRANTYPQASSKQIDTLVDGMLRGVVMYLAALSELSSAIDACASNSTASTAAQLWDGGVAFLIGSAEGSNNGGQDGGQLWYGYAKDFCSDFGTCEPVGSEVDGILFQSLAFGQDALINGKCDQARTVLTSTIQPNLYVPLLQGLLLYARDADGNGEFFGLGYVHAFAGSILPAIAGVDATSSENLAKNTIFNVLTPIPLGLGSMFDNIRNALTKMTTECAKVGKLTIDTVRRGVCTSDEPFTRVPGTLPPKTVFPNTVFPSASPLIPPTPTPLEATDSPITKAEPHMDGIAWGRYEFVNVDVAENDASLSLDVKEMFYANSSAAAGLIYDQGSNLQIGIYGNPAFSSLASLSLRASEFMSEDPMYNFYRYALYEDSSFEEGSEDPEGWPFGDTVIRLALGPGNGNSPHLAAEAAVVINIWMLLVHRLYTSVRKCKSLSADAPIYVDSAVGLWIGKETAEGGFKSGYSMYSLAQSAHELYGNEEGESNVNLKLMNLFKESQQIAKACALGGDKFLDLRVSVNEIITEMSKPLLQMLLYFASREEPDFVELYALAFLPRAAACDINTYAFLRDSFFEGYSLGTMQKESVLVDLGGVLKCLRFTCEDLGDTSLAGEPLRNIVSALCTELEVDYNPKLIAAYETTGNVQDLARLDLDLQQLDLLMRTRSYEAASELYEFGLNSLVDGGNVFSLKKLATEPTRALAATAFQQYKDYFQSDKYADELITATLDPLSTFSFTGSSRLQKAEFVVRTVQTLVSFTAIIARLNSAITECLAGRGGHSQVDEAVAIFAGSIEGSQSGGSKDGSGVMLMSLGKETCEAFDKCETHGDSTSNQFLMFGFSGVKEFFDMTDCDSARSLVTDSILPMLPVSIIQGVLLSATINEALPAQTKNASVATGDILARAILPLVNDVNQTSAATILENMEFSLSQKPVIDRAPAVFEAFTFAMNGMGVDCSFVGTLESSDLSVCNSTSVSPGPGTSTNLGKDLYITTTYVKDRADIALDVRDMEEELSTGGQKTLAQLIYEEGEHSPIFDNRGIKTGRRSLAAFSINAGILMTTNPLFQTAVYALTDDNGVYLGSDATMYADTIVRESFAKGGTSTLAVESAVVLNLWMELANELFQTVKGCKNGFVADTDRVHSIDEAVAYWIGDGQIAGDPERGHLLYRLAEQMGEKFHGVDSSGQSRANTNILRLFHEAKLELSYPGACSLDGKTVKRLRHIVTKITSQMIVVNVQALINFLREGDRDRVRVYAHGYVPFVAACSPVIFSFLKEKLLDSSYQDTEVEAVVRAIERTFPCFAISCDDIGVHKSELSSSCQDPQVLLPLAGYRPSIDVREVAQIDYDIQELDILLKMGALEAADDLYSYGKHAATGLDAGRTALSLSYLATSMSRTSVPEHDSFKRYFGNDNYADTMIRTALDKNNGMSPIQRRWTVVGTARFMITYMAALEAMHLTIDSCQAGDLGRDSTALLHWDSAAAYIIGEMEGSADGGSKEGKLLWGLAKQECAAFNTCSDLIPGSAQVNDIITSLLYTGRGAILSGSCDVLRNSVREMSRVLPVGLVQASLSSLVDLSTSKGANKELAHVKAYIYAQAILPLIADSNRDAARTISDNVDFAGEPLKIGLRDVAVAYSIGLSGTGLDCSQIGSSDAIDGCTGSVSSESKLGIILGVLLGSIAAIGVAILVRVRRRRGVQDKPSFVAPKGILNHSSEQLVGRCRESAPERVGSETQELSEDYNDADSIDREEYLDQAPENCNHDVV
jgi:hypothetical protein